MGAGACCGGVLSSALALTLVLEGLVGETDSVRFSPPPQRFLVLPALLGTGLCGRRGLCPVLPSPLAGWASLYYPLCGGVGRYQWRGALIERTLLSGQPSEGQHSMVPQTKRPRMRQ